ncbi:hypothetical protein [Bacillus sp. NPDC094106]|uniref:hypothetical protein n=1 Tax=Bacillus sp. NPDC094106 TaxID=3363949 RepID=UPI0038226DC1
MGFCIIFAVIITVLGIQLYINEMDWIEVSIITSALSIGFMIGFFHYYTVISPMIDDYEKRKYMKEKYSFLMKKFNEIN